MFPIVIPISIENGNRAMVNRDIDTLNLMLPNSTTIDAPSPSSGQAQEEEKPTVSNSHAHTHVYMCVFFPFLNNRPFNCHVYYLSLSHKLFSKANLF